MLIRPWNYHDEGVAEHDLSREWRNGPYNLLCLATQLKNAGIPFRLVDLEPILVKVCGDDSKCLEYLAYEISSFRPDIIGFSFFSYQFLEVDRIVKYVKAVCHTNRLEPVLIAGGIHASVEPRQTLNELGFDYVFVGEADAEIVELGRGKVPENIPGIVTKHTTTIQKGQPVEELNSLPFVDWSLCDYKFYSHLNSAKISSRPVRTLDLSMSRGCLNRCGFCAYSALSKLRFYSPEYLVDNIAHMLSSYGIDSIYFIDSSVGNNRDVLEGFCKKFMQRNLQYSCEWYANMRADQIDESLLKLLWAAGCRSLFYGFESGSQRILDLMNKHCTVEQNVKAAEIHNRLGFLYHASMVLGYPGETEQDIKLTFDFLERTMPPFIGINWYVPLPGSRDYNRLKKNGKLQVQNPHEWRRIGEVLTTGHVYANIEENHFRQLFSDAQTLVSRITAKDLNTLAGSHPSVTKTKAHSIEQAPPRVERNTIMSEKDLACSSEFELKLREKWRELPATRQERKFSSEMLEWSDEELLAYWEECKQQTCTPEVRGWYQELHKNEFAGLEIADVGPGVGLDGIFFAEHGAHVTFVDIVVDNLKLLKRICRLKGVETDYYFIDDFFNFHFSKEFDAFVCIGSLINAPFEFMKRQIEAMSKFLKVNGKVLMLAYPKERYLQSGAQDFAEFGKMTDGERTPWAEWYDDEKVEALFGPNFKLNWSRNFGEDNIEFNWFELTKIESETVDVQHRYTNSELCNINTLEWAKDCPCKGLVKKHADKYLAGMEIKRILDFGSGTNEEITEIVPEAEEYHFLDERSLPPQKTNYYLLKQSASKKIPLPDNYLDVVTTNGSFDHFTQRDRIEAFLEIERCLRPGGIFLFGCEYIDFTPRDNFFLKTQRDADMLARNCQLYDNINLSEIVEKMSSLKICQKDLSKLPTGQPLHELVSPQEAKYYTESSKNGTQVTWGSFIVVFKKELLEIKSSQDNIESNRFELAKLQGDVYSKRKKQYGCNILQPATHQFTCHGQTPQPTFGQQESVGTACATKPKILVEPQQENSITIPSVPVQRLHEELGFARAINYPQSSLNKPLEQWKMEVDDSPIFRYIYHNILPRRHLEFGTWQGAGTLYCLEECDATVWTINLPGGENKSNGLPAYSLYPDELASAREWAERIGMAEQDSYRTDCLGFIGRFYLEKGLGSRVCQIYGDSTKWDISNYPPMFFDTALIDGGHKEDVVITDTAKAFELLRSGGLIMWHDFCPPIYDKFETTLGVMRAIHQQWEWINEQTLKLFWICPSWILVGVKK